MGKAGFRFGLLFGVFLLAIIPFGCKRSPAGIPVLKINPDALKYADEGDAHLREGHLYGWRRAEASYQKAYDLAGSNEFKKKLLMSRFLVMTRQVDEDIPYPRVDEMIRELCSGDETRKTLCEIAQWYKSNKKSQPPDIKSGSVFNGEQPELEDYFKRLFADDKTQLNASSEGLAVQPIESPLSLYLSPWKLKTKDPAEVEKAYPGFAEALGYIAETSFQKKKYGAARNGFRKALELIPDYTRAINGLGNIYFFALEDYEQALRWYESASEQDPTNTAAQFGKGAALHKLGRYQESNAAFDRMLVADRLKDGRLDEAGYRYYSGEGYYLKAYNYRLMDDVAKARELIDLARQFLPDSAEINEFSGVLYFNAQRLEEARKDFLRVLARGNSSCNAQMHLGLIYHQIKYAGTDPVAETRRILETGSLREESAEKRALNYFLGACSCMDSGIRQLKDQIDSVPALDLEAREKILFSDRLKSKLLDFRMASSADIERMIGKASQTGIPERDTYLKLMREILVRIQKQ
jgi:tetratricopeptide (TPR) repeat protein